MIHQPKHSYRNTTATVHPIMLTPATYSPLLHADDTSFNQLVLKAPVPTIALFSARECDECQPCLEAFRRLAQHYFEQVRVVTLDIEESIVIAESFGIQLVPIYMLFRHGEPLAYGLGYMPTVLLDQFFQLATTLDRQLRVEWQPTEQEIETTLLVPMLMRWGWVCQRQYECKVRSHTRSRRGIIDMLVATDVAARPLTLFENKRRINSYEDLQRASAQALSYALALDTASFVIADAKGMWVYQVHGEHAVLAAQFAADVLEREDTPLRDLLLALGSRD